jgi:hypothetical protein
LLTTRSKLASRKAAALRDLPEGVAFVHQSLVDHVDRLHLVAAR